MCRGTAPFLAPAIARAFRGGGGDSPRFWVAPRKGRASSNSTKGLSPGTSALRVFSVKVAMIAVLGSGNLLTVPSRGSVALPKELVLCLLSFLETSVPMPSLVNQSSRVSFLASVAYTLHAIVGDTSMLAISCSCSCPKYSLK